MKMRNCRIRNLEILGGLFEGVVFDYWTGIRGNFFLVFNFLSSI